MSPAATPSRWCPTPEQVMILEEIYRNGLKTPNATQIQHITSHLSFYGKIEGKNVFYWFQNHKARDRQKLRRKLYKHLQLQQHQLFMKRHRFDEHQLFHYFLQQPQNQRVPQLLPLPTACFLERESEEGSTTKVESGGRMWFGGDDGTTGAENEDGDAETTCRSGTLRTLELFPVRGSWVKEEESGSGNSGWGH